MPITVSQAMYDNLVSQRDSHRAAAEAANHEKAQATARASYESKSADDLDRIIDDLQVQ